MKERKKQYSDFDKSIINLFLKGKNTNLTVKEVSKRIGFKDRKDFPIIESHLNNLLRDRVLIMLNSKKYQIDPTFMKEEVGYLHYLVGIVDMKQTGKAYVIPEDESEDVFIAINNTAHALKGDKVKVYLFPQRKKHKREGQIVEILERKKDSFVGIIQRHENYSFLIADDNSMPVDIFLPKGCEMDAKDGEKALAKITEWPERANNPFGKVLKVLGTPGDNDVEMQSILSDFNFPLAFPEEVEEEAEKIQETIPESEIKKRKDFRSTMTFTIDPIDAKDFDDAISIKQLNNEEFEVGVHIADVSYYVKPQSFLNREAYKRATSVYLVDRTIPMLPEKLCNEVCSLRQDEDSLTFSVVFVINKNTLEISKHWIGRTVINSNRRFNYDEVQKVIEDNQGEKSEYILPLWDIAKGLREKRFSKGAINFETPEVKFRLDENKKPIGIYIKETKEANWLVEEFMLLANKTVAEDIGKVKNKNQAKTFVYRVHDEPNQEKVATFKTFVSKLGYKIDDKSRKSLVNSYNTLFNKVKGKGEETLISTIALRTMSKAFYSTFNIGHYGLSFKYYTHFTSPIRRYPDVMVHRLLEAYLDKEPSKNQEQYEEYCKHCSQMEKASAEAERQSIKYKQAEYLSDKIGQDFVGKISGISKWGIYVLIDDNKCEGLVKIESINDDFYTLDEDNYQIIGREFGKVYQLGQQVKVNIKKVNMIKKQIEFTLETDENTEVNTAEKTTKPRSKKNKEIIY